MTYFICMCIYNGKHSQKTRISAAISIVLPFIHYRDNLGINSNSSFDDKYYSSMKFFNKVR